MSHHDNIQVGAKTPGPEQARQNRPLTLPSTSSSSDSASVPQFPVGTGNTVTTVTVPIGPSEVAIPSLGLSAAAFEIRTPRYY